MLIVDQIVNNNADPTAQLLYNPINWADADNVFFGPTDNWLQPPVATTVNGRADAFSQRYALNFVVNLGMDLLNGNVG
jgi:hypothetical protein